MIARWNADLFIQRRSDFVLPFKQPTIEHIHPPSGRRLGWSIGIRPFEIASCFDDLRNGDKPNPRHSVVTNVSIQTQLVIENLSEVGQEMNIRLPLIQ